MTTKNWYDTTISFEGALSAYGLKELARLKADPAMFNIAKFILSEDKILNKKWLEDLNDQYGLIPTTANVFYRPAHFQTTAHTDGGRERKAIVSLNWIDGDDDSDMIWYEQADQPEMTENEAKMVCYEYDPADLTEVDRACVGNRSNLVLVRTDVPHNVFVRDKARLAICLRFWDDFDSWDNAVNSHFKDCIIEQE